MTDDVRTQVTQYAVSAMPEDGPPDGNIWTIHVQYRGGDKWAVVRSSRCLSTAGNWDLEPPERNDAWLDTHRYTREGAIATAQNHAPYVVVNGKTAMQAYEQWKKSERVEA